MKFETVFRGPVDGLTDVEVLYEKREVSGGTESRTVLKHGRKTMVVSQGFNDWETDYKFEEDTVFQAFRQIRSGWLFRYRYDEAHAARRTLSNR